jgi:hypothetical protein
MASEVDICNMALGLLGTGPITSFSDPSTEAQLCELWYPYLVSAVLEQRTWTFATKRVQLIQTTPPFPQPAMWSSCFAVPIDYINIIQCYLPNTSPSGAYYVQEQIDGLYQQISWEMLENFIFTNTGSSAGLGTWCKYVANVVDPSQYSPGFVQALSARIAADLCIPITNNRDLHQDMVKLYAEKLMDASGKEGSQGTTQKIQGRTLRNTRW